VNLSDDADTVVQKIRKAKTDAEPLPSEGAGLEGRPEAANLVTIYAALADTTPDAVLAQFAGQGFGAFKPALADLLVETLRPIRDRFIALKDDSAAIDALLQKGADKATALGRPTLDAAYKALGLLR
jgi:tryptophanyl-tRNA synthetase